jgi:SAM-dependent methyltransferase
VETKAGVIAVTNDRVIYGGGDYDGRVVIDFVNDRNGIFRPFVLSAFHPAPKRILMIGLSVGSWGQVIVNHPDVEELVVVEINPGYLDLTSRYPEVASLLKNPKVKFVIDDGRRWMRNHQGEGFDFVVMNTTWHWRAFAGNLLSVEYLNLARKVLKPNGIVYYNGTGSPEAARTAAMTFPHAVRFATMILASEQPIHIDIPRWEAVLRQYRLDGKPVVGNDQASEDAIVMNRARLSAEALNAKGPQYHVWNTMQDRAGILADTDGMPIITDDNMGQEWRRERQEYY